MSVASTFAIAINGLSGSIVEVESSLSAQLPGMAIIGLPDTSLNEAKQRIRVACQNSELMLSRRFITLNLSPADLPKTGSSFDLALALCALGASGTIPLDRLRETVHIGELALDGSVRETRGVLPAVLSAKRHGLQHVLVPARNVSEAQLVEGMNIIGVRTLREAEAWHRGQLPNRDCTASASTSRSEPFAAAELSPDIAEITGQDDVIEALTIAAVGGHNVAMIGAPGTGKTMLASRLPGLLPDLTFDDAIEATSLASLAGGARISALQTRPPFVSPHHSATLTAMVGGGTKTISPGIISLATNGVLFLDEATEFSPSVLDALRQPLESGTISIHRAGASATLPAKFMLVLAANPCPCGNAGLPGLECTCAGGTRRRYAQRISGPLRDRIDMNIRVRRLSASLYLRSPTSFDGSRCSSVEVRARVSEARARTAQRLAHTPWRLNKEVPGTWLRAPENQLSSVALSPLDHAFDQGRVSMRGYDRILRMAWSIADLEQEPAPRQKHVALAMNFRSEAAL